MSKEGCVVCQVVGILTIIGALNWGLVGAFNINLVDQVFGLGSALGRVVYVVIGLAGLAAIAGYFKLCPCCKK